MSTKSTDGVAITAARSGHGPPLVLVHGTGADHGRWAPVLPGLEAHFTVHAMDRRGRGASRDTADYTLEREFDDIAALVDSIGEPVALLGHSHGAICSLEAALRTTQVQKLVLYEPPIPVGTPIYPAATIGRLQALLDQGDREAVVATFFTDVVRMPPAQLQALRSLLNWPARLAAAHTIPREMHADVTYRFEAARFAVMNIPTLLLLGGDSAPFFRAAIDQLYRALPSSQVVVLTGQQHTAMNTAPELFVREVVGFLTD